MGRLVKKEFLSMWNSSNRMLFRACIADLIDSPSVQAMRNVSQHVDINCFEHCVFVAYVSFLICRRMGWDFRAAARGGLLHDLFLYDWHQKGSHQGLHGFTHPEAALRNASQICALTEVEQDIIVKHMWPLTLRKVPKYRESFVVSSADKICALAEMLQIYRLMRVAKKLNVCCSQA